MWETMFNKWEKKTMVHLRTRIFWERNYRDWVKQDCANTFGNAWELLKREEEWLLLKHNRENQMGCKWNESHRVTQDRIGKYLVKLPDNQPSLNKPKLWCAFRKQFLQLYQKWTKKSKIICTLFSSRWKVLLLDKWGLRTVYNGSEVYPLEIFIHVDKVSSYINPSKDRVDAQHSVMRE